LVKPQETRLQGELGLDARETVRVWGYVTPLNLFSFLYYGVWYLE
jgi:hypothetical protein